MGTSPDSPRSLRTLRCVLLTKGTPSIILERLTDTRPTRRSFLKGALALVAGYVLGCINKRIPIGDQIDRPQDLEEKDANSAWWLAAADAPKPRSGRGYYPISGDRVMPKNGQSLRAEEQAKLTEVSYFYAGDKADGSSRVYSVAPYVTIDGGVDPSLAKVIGADAAVGAWEDLWVRGGQVQIDPANGIAQRDTGIALAQIHTGTFRRMLVSDAEQNGKSNIEGDQLVELCEFADNGTLKAVTAKYGGAGAAHMKTTHHGSVTRQLFCHGGDRMGWWFDCNTFDHEVSFSLFENIRSAHVAWEVCRGKLHLHHIECRESQSRRSGMARIHISASRWADIHHVYFNMGWEDCIEVQVDVGNRPEYPLGMTRTSCAYAYLPSRRRYPAGQAILIHDLPEPNIPGGRGRIKVHPVYRVRVDAAPDRRNNGEADVEIWNCPAFDVVRVA